MLIWCVWIYFPNLAQLNLLPSMRVNLFIKFWRFAYFWYNSSQWMKLLWLTPHISIPPFNNWSIWMSTQTSRYVLTWLWQCHLQLQRAKGPSSFYLHYFLLSKKFNHVAKKASSILSQVVSLTTSWLPPLQDTPHHHGRSLVRDTPHWPQLTYFRHCWDGEILTLTWHP